MLFMLLCNLKNTNFRNLVQLAVAVTGAHIFISYINVIVYLSPEMFKTPNKFSSIFQQYDRYLKFFNDYTWG